MRFDYVPEYGPEDLDEAYVISLGGKICLPEWNEIQIDLDSEEAHEEFKKRVSLMYQMCQVAMKVIGEPSKTPGHYHVRIYFDRVEPFSHIERIALQAILGSDWKRELFGWFRAMNGNDKPTSFVEAL